MTACIVNKTVEKPSYLDFHWNLGGNIAHFMLLGHGPVKIWGI